MRLVYMVRDRATRALVAYAYLDVARWETAGPGYWVAASKPLLGSHDPSTWWGQADDAYHAARQAIERWGFPAGSIRSERGGLA